MMNQRVCAEKYFLSFDGTSLFYRVWEPKVALPEKKALIILHRGHEHSGRLYELLEGLALENFYAFAFDLRGHGLSPGARGYAPDFSYHVKDLNTFSQLITQEYEISIKNIAIVANSVGAVIATTWVHDYAPEVRCMALAAPAFDIKLYVPLALLGLKILNSIKKPAFISSYVKAKFLTHDQKQIQLYEQDPLITREISVNVLIGLYENSKRVIQDAQAIQVPTLLLSAGSDWVVHQKAQKKFIAQLGSSVKEFLSYSKFYHGLLYEKDRHLPLSKIRDFITSQFQTDFKSVSFLKAHEQGYTYVEYQKLLFQSPGLLKSCFYGLQRITMSLLGRLSKGIQVGLLTGFDSGLSLDHVYKNKAQGITFIGRLIDYFYINQLGWRGIRGRKVHIQEALEEGINKLLKEKKPVRILDIAAGGGRYLIETAKKYENRNVRVLIRDKDQKNIDEATQTAKSLNLVNIEFQVADAFDPQSYENLVVTPNIVIVSGLYELFSNNDLVLSSLKSIASIIQEGGLLIYTGQPWHPQLEMIAHTLKNRDQERWVMRRRTQLELDSLVRECGFEKIEMKLDRWGIFSVGIAQEGRLEHRSGIIPGLTLKSVESPQVVHDLSV